MIGQTISKIIEKLRQKDGGQVGEARPIDLTEAS